MSAFQSACGRRKRSYMLLKLGSTQFVMCTLRPHLVKVHLGNTLSFFHQTLCVVVAFSVLAWHVYAHYIFHASVHLIE